MNIEQYINKNLLEKQEKRKDRKHSGKWTPSRFGRCYRFQIWKRRGTEETNPPDERALRIFKVGDMFHEFIEQLIVKENPEAETEVFTEKGNVLGYADIVTDDEVIELKSQHSRAFWYMKKDSYDITKERYNHILQVMAYCKMLNKKKGRLVYISKDDLCISEYGFYLNGKWTEELKKELTTLNKWWESGRLPPAKPKAYGGKECRYCSFKTKCKEVENEVTSTKKDR